MVSGTTKGLFILIPEVKKKPILINNFLLLRTDYVSRAL